MSTTKLLHDLSFWEKKEETFVSILTKEWWTEIKRKGKMNVHDYIATSPKGEKFSLELKTRRCEKNQYDDALIWANKLAEAWSLYYKEWLTTLFVFQYVDWVFYINPLDYSPRREFKLQRFDRGNVDNKKGWIYFKTELIQPIWKLN